jgi:molecular chaperone DnaK
MTYCLGIDVGTTYTAAAVARGGRAEMVALGHRATSVPTVVALTEERTFVVGDAAERRGAAHPESLAREFKRRVGDPTPLMLAGTPVPVNRLLAEVLSAVRRSVVEAEGGPPAATVVTYPANWGSFKQAVLEEAVRIAELGPTTLLAEPVAAATWYAQAERVAAGGTVAVYDLGGGTFDAAVLEMGADGAFAVRGRPEGVEHLGGVDVDAAVVDHVLRTLGIGSEDPDGPDGPGELDPDDPAAVRSLARLRRECVEAKEALSSETAVTIPVALPGREAEVRLERSELEELIAPLLAPTFTALRRAVESADLDAGDPDAVLLVGGASRMPLVGREVSIAFGRPVAIDAHPKHPVALGAATTESTDHAEQASGAPTTAGGADTAGAALGPGLAWRVPLGQATPGAPATDGQRVYVVDESATLTAIDVARGRPAWTASIGSQAIVSTPVIAGDVVVATASEPAQVQGLDAATGAVRWTVPDAGGTTRRWRSATPSSYPTASPSPG